MSGLGDWSGFKRCVTIGQFSQDMEGRATYQFEDESGSYKVPDGRQVEVRLVDGYDAGNFTRVFMKSEASTGRTEEASEYGYSHCSAHDDDVNPNLFVSEGCYHYLYAWID